MRRQSKLARLQKVFGLGMMALLAKLRKKELPKSEILSGILELGGVYIKFLQVVAVRNISVAVLDGENLKSISRIYDQVALEDIDIKQLLATELGEQFNTLKHIEDKPFASGSFGQVYRAKLDSGEELAIKVIRPSVVRNINFDLNLLGLLVRIFSLSNKSAFDIKKIYSQFAGVTRRELDYVSEAKYAQLLYDKYRNHPSMVIPRTYPELCSKHIIAQEFIKGISATEILVQKEHGVDPATYVRKTLGSDLRYQLMCLGKEQLESMLVDGYSHGDPHPGNIVLMTDNRIALLDFGIKSRSPTDRKAFFGIIKEYQKIYSGHFDFESYTIAIMNLFVGELSGAVNALDRYSRGMVSEHILTAIKSAVDDIYQGSKREATDLLDRQKHLLVFNTVINQDNRFGLKFEIDQPEFMRATNIYINLVEALGYKQEVLNGVYTAVATKYQGVEFVSSSRKTSPDEAVEVISGWLDDIASRDIYLFQILSSKINERLIGV